MKFLNTRNVIVGIVALSIGCLAVFGIAKSFAASNETVTGRVAAFILNPEGTVEGAILETGEQVHFGAETGAIVARQIKVGDALTVAGRGGDKSNYGREFKAETLQIGEQTITVVRAKKPKPHGKGKEDADKKAKGKKHKEPKGEKPLPPNERPAPPIIENQVGENIPPPPAPREMMTANGNVRFVLVGKNGEPKGLILSDGTQVALAKEIKDANLTFNEQTTVNVEGEAAKSDFGAVIKPTRLTIGNQTFSFNR